MNQTSPDARKEIQLIPADLKNLGAICQAAPSSLSPLGTPGAGVKPDTSNTVLFDTEGHLLPYLQTALDVLCHPTAATALSTISTEAIFDWAVYHDSNGQAVALSHAGNSLWLQQPPPIPAVVEKLRQSLLPGTGLQQLDWRLTRTEAWAAWGVIDLLHISDISERFSLADLAGTLDMPAQGITWLAAHFRDSLQLPLPAQEALQTACSSLVEKGLLRKMGEKYVAGDELKMLAGQIGEVHWYTRLRISSELQPGEVTTFEEFLVQWESGQCLAWYALDETVVILGKQPQQLLEMVASALIQPAAYFIKPQPENPVAKPGQVLQQGPVPLPRKKPKWPWIVAGVVALLLICCIATLLIGTLTGYIRWQ